MGFFKDLMDARPSKSHERATQIHESGVKSVILIPDFMQSTAIDCAICKVRFGQVFAKDLFLFLISTQSSIPFTQDKTSAVICNKCVYHFGYDQYNSDL